MFLRTGFAIMQKGEQMSDLISRLSELRSQYNCFNANERDAYHTLSEAIEALKEQKTGKWIPCSEEIPKMTGYYIATCHDGVCYRTSVVKWSTGWVLTGARSYWKVIAWMPLPTPYKEDEV